MAAKKPQNKKSHDGPKAVVVFWIIFVVVIVCIAVINWPTITRNFGLAVNMINNSSSEEEFIDEELETEIADNSAETARNEKPAERITPEVVIIDPVPNPAPAPERNSTPSVTTETEQSSPQQPSAQQSPAQQPAQSPQVQPSSPPPAETRERSFYYAQVSSDGQIYPSKVTRRLPVSQTPLQDVINTMLSGPNADELRNNNVNLIPQNTRLLNATVRGSTAYLNFSEDFMFNTFGVVGYIAQLRQVVWTATEFPNIRDVQILVEGRRIDYLAEGIWIGSPIGRQ